MTPAQPDPSVIARADARIAQIVSTADRLARMMGGRFVVDPARIDAFRQYQIARDRAHLLEQKS